MLKPRDEWEVDNKTALIEKLSKVMKQTPSLDFSFTQPIDMRVSEMVLGVRGDLAIKLFGEDLNTLSKTAQEIVDILESIKGSQDVDKPENSGIQYLQIKVNRSAAGKLGLTIAEVNQILQTQIEGQQLGIVQEGARHTPILLRGSDAVRLSPTTFSQLLITLPNGHNIPLSSIASLERTEGPVKIDRERGIRMVVVTANVQGRDLVSFVEEAKQKVSEKVKMPQGYWMKWGGQFENQ